MLLKSSRRLLTAAGAASAAMTVDTAALSALMAAPPLPQQDQETRLVEDALAGPQLEEGWRWLREEHAAWRFGADAVEFPTTPGGLWGSAFNSQPTPALLLRPLADANACEVTVTMPPGPGGFGEQAGLFWYVDDDNYIKLVVEWMRDGSTKVVLAREREGQPEVIGKADLDEDEAEAPVRLRLELSADGSQLSGVVVGAYYMRLVGRCSAELACKTADGAATVEPRLGLSAHGGAADRAARLRDFAAIAVRPNRVQWGGGATMAAARVVAPIAPPAQANLLIASRRSRATSSRLPAQRAHWTDMAGRIIPSGA